MEVTGKTRKEVEWEKESVDKMRKKQGDGEMESRKGKRNLSILPTSVTYAGYVRRHSRIKQLKYNANTQPTTAISI